MKKALSILALALVALTASASEPAYKITEVAGIRDHCSVTYKVNGNDATPENGVINVNENDGITVTITPDEGWIATPSGQWSAAVTRGGASDFAMLKDIVFTPAGENTWTFTMERANALISVKYIKIIQDTWIQDIPSTTYTGSAKKPNVTVKDGDYTLVEGKDYTVTYSNNTNAGTATVTVTGKGNYTGSASKNFTINKASRYVTFTPYQFTRTFGDPDFTIVPTTSGGGILSYSSNDISIATVNSSTGKVHIVGVGKVRITARLSGSSNYKAASDWYEVTVVAKEVAATMIGEIAEQTYTGSPLTPAVVVTDGDATLTEETDYTVEYTNNTETGEATVTITGKGNYTGTASTTFTIVADKTTLDGAITDAAAYYESITADYADIAATLLEAINAAKGVQADKAATQQAVDNAAEALKKAVQDAKDAVQVITGIDSVKVSAVNSVWYDLNGRKLEGNPTKKGVYIQNGRKVIVR